MNKTVNINLANSLFHIDDTAYDKLRRYLESVKRSFAGTAGSDEIIADIEARIAELFLEKMENERQVITQKEVDDVINIMGQPEDYMIDEDIFEDQPKSSSNTGGTTTRVKKLYRDIDQKYIGGVCSGLEHYLGFDALWIRLIFLLLGVFTGFGIIAYILLWILVPEAASTSQKLDMTGKAVNISNIERKVKEGFDDVADKVKNVDYEKVGSKVKSGSKTFFDTVGDIIMFLFKVFGKFIGILLIIIGAATLIGLFIGLFTVGIIDLVHFPGVDFYDIINTTGAPVWAVSLLCFFAIGIPFFFLLYLGLKILVTNLKSIGNIAKFSLLGLWLISVGILIALGVRQAAAHAFTGTTTINEEYYAADDIDTLKVRMQSTENIDYDNRFTFDNLQMAYDDDGNAVLYTKDIRFDVKKSVDSVVRLKIRKDATGSSFEEARERSAGIDYGYALVGKELVLNDYLITSTENKMRDQEVRSTLYIPEGMYINFDDTVNGNIGRSTKNDRDYYRSDIVDYLWLMGSDGELKCQNCPMDSFDDDDGNGKIIINEDGIDININDRNEKGKIIINEDGIDIDVEDNGESFKMKLDENGVEIKAEDDY
ncbi:PspC domain-containing protein [uncultured Croceitalea sp.]|uniref:PspC domain-containing protein n=1 Tax=uncultured Croceitalea sp. TaxID=1798908 RepID=UPI003305E9F3